NEAEVDGANHALQYDVLVAATTSEADQLQAATEDLDERRSMLAAGIAENRQLFAASASPALTKAVDDIQAPLAAYGATAAAAKQAATSGAGVSKDQLVAVDDAQAAFDVRLDALTAQINAHVAQAAAEAARTAQRARLSVLLLLVGACLFVTITGVLIW